MECILAVTVPVRPPFLTKIGKERCGGHTVPYHPTHRGLELQIQVCVARATAHCCSNRF